MCADPDEGRGNATNDLPPIEPTLTINDVVERYPQLMPVLASHGLDLCCGGPLTLRQAAEQHGLDLDALVAELTAALAVGAGAAIP